MDCMKAKNFFRHCQVPGMEECIKELQEAQSALENPRVWDVLPSPLNDLMESFFPFE